MVYNNERLLCDGIDQKKFFKSLRLKGYTEDILTMLFTEDNFQTTDICDFNSAIRNINKIDKIPIFDMLVYLEKHFAEPKKVLSILDDRTTSMLRVEAEKSFNIKIPSCSLSEFF